jgi:conjugative relaxase-like TrwC/TraI family protein
MITVVAVGSAGDSAAYYARTNYYTADPNEGASRWAGKGCAELGLSGQVETTTFERVLAGEFRTRPCSMSSAGSIGQVGT